MRTGFFSTIFLLLVLTLFAGSFSSSSLGFLSEAQAQGKKDFTINGKTLKLQDLMPPFQYEKEDSLLPSGMGNGRLPASLQLEEEEDQFYKEQMQRTFEALDRFQGNF